MTDNDDSPNGSLVVWRDEADGSVKTKFDDGTVVTLVDAQITQTLDRHESRFQRTSEPAMRPSDSTPVEMAKQRYVDGEIGILGLEAELEDALEEECHG